MRANRVVAQSPKSKSSSPQFRAACRKALRRARGLDAVCRDRIVADLRLEFEHAGEYVAFIDRHRNVDGRRRLSREVLAHSPLINGVQRAVTDALPRDQPRIVVRYVDAADAGVELPYELPGRD